MNTPPLKVLSSEEAAGTKNSSQSAKSQQKIELHAQMEREWLRNPAQFDPCRNCLEKERIKRTFTLIKSCGALKDLAVADIGCGFGTLSRLARDEKAKVLAVDIAANALKNMQSLGNIEYIELRRDALPCTLLPDSYYDLVICTEVITYLPTLQYRLAISELSRLMKDTGYIVCSTELDCYTLDPLNKFSALLATEFKIELWVLSYHRLHNYFSKVFSLPQHYLELKNNKPLKNKVLAEKGKIGRALLRINLFLAPMWRVLSFVFKPIIYLLNNNHSLMKALEALSRFIWDDAAATHAIAIGKKKPLFFDAPEEPPLRMEGKKRVWE